MEEKLLSDDAGGTEAVTDMGLWTEKKDAICMSGMHFSE